MKITYSWLKDYIDIKLKPEELAHRLTMAGLEVTGMQKLGGDCLLEVEVTTNRPDWLSAIGIAREVAAITSKKLKEPQFKIVKPAQQAPEVDLIDKQGCPRYTARIIEDVKVGPSPRWLADKLAAVGVRTVNNVVDITNFCLLEYGQPLHAFDFDKLKGGKVVIRKAKKGESITTIDGIERELDSSILVIADSEKPVALAGIMGGIDTEVTKQTKTVLLESAYFDAATIRRTSKKLGLSSESSYRFERRVDLEAVARVSDRATVLICELAGCKQISSMTDKGKKSLPSGSITLSPAKTNQILGTDIPAAKMKSILVSLGVKPKGKSSFQPPSWRKDLTREVDLIEEIARIWGYDKIPVCDVEMKPATESVMPLDMEITGKVRDLLIAFGLDETVNYSLTNPQLALSFGADSKDLVKIKNPLSPKLACMRANLAPELLSSVRFNINRKNADVKIFEIGPVYSAKSRGKCEKVLLGIALSGNRSDNWQDKQQPVDIFYLKGIIEGLLEKLGIRAVKFAVKSNVVCEAAQSVSVMIEGRQAGYLGKLSQPVANKLDMDSDVFLAELDLSTILNSVNLTKMFKPIPKFPPVLRDVSLVVKNNVKSDEIETSIISIGGKLIDEAKLFDQYKGKNIPRGHKSLAYSIRYQAADRTLVGDEIETLHKKICDGLQQGLGAQIRST